MRWPSVALALLACAVAVSDGRAEAPDPGHALRDRLRAHLDAEIAAVRRADGAVDDKRAARTDERRRRARAAYKVLRAGAPLWADPAARMSVARRSAAARHLLARDRAELALLDDEGAQLDLAGARLGGERALAEVAPVPTERLAWPAPPSSVTALHHFGTVVHDASRAVLSRRGLDLEVAVGTAALAMADGTVRYAGPIRGLGNGVVIDHGASISVTAELAEVRGAVGDAVRRGDAIGRAAARHIYIEVRLPLGPGGLPVDPEALLPPRTAAAR